MPFPISSTAFPGVHFPHPSLRRLERDYPLRSSMCFGVHVTSRLGTSLFATSAIFTLQISGMFSCSAPARCSQSCWRAPLDNGSRAFKTPSSLKQNSKLLLEKFIERPDTCGSPASRWRSFAERSESLARPATRFSIAPGMRGRRTDGQEPSSLSLRQPASLSGGELHLEREAGAPQLGCTRNQGAPVAQVLGDSHPGQKHHPCGAGSLRLGRAPPLVSFMDYDLGYFDLETRVLEPLENPFGPKVLPM